MPALATAPAAAGERIAPGYRVLSHLSRGRLLDTYEVWSDERRCGCVAKTVRPDLLARRDARAALRTEGRLLTSLSHPHIVRAYELRERPLPVLVLESLTGETLAHLLARRTRRLALADVAWLGVHLCSAIAYVHARGFLHLDLKPSNIVCDCGFAKLIDFSIARPRGHARSGSGTRVYMAPEQARHDLLTEATDVWGLGSVLYEAATGRRPHAGERLHDPQRLERRADPVCGSRRLPRALGAAIDACLEPVPRDRPTIGELADALEAWVEQSARPPCQK